MPWEGRERGSGKGRLDKDEGQTAQLVGLQGNCVQAMKGRSMGRWLPRGFPGLKKGAERLLTSQNCKVTDRLHLGLWLGQTPLDIHTSKFCTIPETAGIFFLQHTLMKRLNIMLTLKDKCLEEFQYHRAYRNVYSELSGNKLITDARTYVQSL